MNNTAKIAELEKLYAQLPTIVCQQKCQDYCGQIAMSRLEAKRLPELQFQRLWWLTQIGQKSMGRCFATNVDTYGTCPMLKDGLCAVYDRRPAICRLWGLTEKLRCPHGCEPSVRWNEQQATDWLKAVAEIGL